MKITYTKIITESRTCDHCQGTGYKYEKLYHNQMHKCKCYMCNGKGFRDFTWSVDVTAEVEQLLSNTNSLTQKN